MSPRPEYEAFVVRPEDMGDFMIELVDTIHESAEVLNRAVNHVAEVKRRNGFKGQREDAGIAMFADFCRKVQTAYADMVVEGERVHAAYDWPF